MSTYKRVTAKTALYKILKYPYYSCLNYFKNVTITAVVTNLSKT